jgi:hypothetical protein
MTNLSAHVLNEHSEKLSGDERRASVRYGCSMDGVCEPIALPTASQPEERWHGSVRDISTGGVRLSLVRRFEPGTTLQLEIPTKQGENILTFNVIVVHVIQSSGNGWEFGCKFEPPLSDEDLKALI